MDYIKVAMELLKNYMDIRDFVDISQREIKRIEDSQRFIIFSEIIKNMAAERPLNKDYMEYDKAAEFLYYYQTLKKESGNNYELVNQVEEALGHMEQEGLKDKLIDTINIEKPDAEIEEIRRKFAIKLLGIKVIKNSLDEATRYFGRF